MLLALPGLLGCSEDAPQSPPTDQLPTCGDFEMALPDGSCHRPGILPDTCGAGFVHDGGYGCDPILPTEPCPAGLLAVPGDESCREIMACSDGTWGDIPVDGTTQHVDGAAGASAPDGSAEQPWPTIQEAVDAAAPGALVAVAGGDYHENVLIQGKAVRLWGVCPSQATLLGVTLGAPALEFRFGADGSEVVGLGVSGEGMGIAVYGANPVTLDRVWVHDTFWRGVVADGAYGQSAVTLTDSLIERARGIGVFMESSGLTMERSVVRATQPDQPAPVFGRGLNIQLSCDQSGCLTTPRSNAVIRASVVEQNHDVGIYFNAADGWIEDSVVRWNLPQQYDSMSGRGVSIEPCSDGCDSVQRANVTMRTSVIDQNYDIGFWVSGSDATIENSVVRRTAPNANLHHSGRGISVQACFADQGCTPTSHSNVAVRTSLVETNHDYGIFLSSSEGSLADSVVRDTAPRAADQNRGRGVGVQYSCNEAGDCEPTAGATIDVRRTLIARNYDLGLAITGSVATVDQTVVRDTFPCAVDGLYGDGIALFSHLAPAGATITNTRIEASARSGLSNFGGDVSLQRAAIRCAAFDLNGETYEGYEPGFQDLGDNLCGCPAATAECRLVSAGLSPPEPVGMDR